MEYPNLSFHVHQILSALQDISNHLAYLPDRHRGNVSASLQQLSEDMNELVSDIDMHSGAPTLANEYATSDKTVDVTPFDRTETVAVFDQYIVLNVDGEFTYANPLAFTIFGHSEADLKGKNIWEDYPELVDSPLFVTIKQAVESQLPAQLEMQGINQRWFAMSVHPTRHGVIIYWIDITTRKAIEQALHDTEERFRLALETAPINVFTLDKDLRYVWVGPRRDAFFHEPVIGKRDDELLPAQDAAILMEAEQYVIDTGKGLRKEVRFSKNSHPLIYNMVLEPLFDRSNQVVGLTIAVMDVTEQRRLEAEKQAYAAQVELRQRLIDRAEMERVSLAQDLHDGPIQSLVGLGFSLQMVKERLQEDRADTQEELQQLGDNIKDVVVEIRNICSELRPPVLFRFGLEEAIRASIEEFQAKHPGIGVTLEFPGEPLPLPEPVILALYRIYQHAMDNILHHAHASQVGVRFIHHPQQAIFEIQDNGRGFPQPFDWVKYTREGHLGMVGMQERAEAIGGTLQVISQPGEGTTVQVIIPSIG